MPHDFAPKLAKVMTTYSVPVEPGNLVVIQSTTEAIPMMEALAAAVMERGGVPHMVVNVPGWDEYFLLHANDAQRAFVNPMSVAVYEHADIVYNLDAPAHTNALISIPNDRMASGTKDAVLAKFFERTSSGATRWCLAAWPTNARAQQADMGFHAYQRFVYEAYGLHLDDPVAYWQAMAAKQAKYIDFLTGKSHIDVRGPGIDLRFSMEGRAWYGAAGNANFPDGEILTCPIEDSVNGHVAFSYPGYHNGHRVDGIELTFVDGVVTEASAARGEEYLLNQLDVDANARRLGEFAIGTNDYIQQVTGSTLMDEKIGGTIHMALGQSAAPNEGKNPSKIHWDIVHDMRAGEIVVDGERIYQNGKFLIA